MKKLYKPIFIFLTSIIFLGINSCSVLEQLFFNLKLNEEFHSTGSGPDISEVIFDCLTNDDSFDDNYDKIQSLSYVSAAYYTLDATPPNLGGTNISATLRDCNNNIILQQSLPTAQASDYIQNPYEFVLTQSEIATFNQFLSNYKDCDCFNAVLLVEQVTPAGLSSYTLNGTVEIIIEVEANLN